MDRAPSNGYRVLTGSWRKMRRIGLRPRTTGPASVLNCARARARRDQRTVPFSALSTPIEDPFEPAVDPSQFQGPNDRHPGGWRSFPTSWAHAPDEQVLAAEAGGYIRAAIDALPLNQREVMLLRDVQGCSFEEHLGVCPGCAEYLEQMRQTILVTGRLTEESLDPVTRDQLLGLFQNWQHTD